MTVYVARTHVAHRAPRRPWRMALVAAMVVLFAVAAGTLGPWLWQVHRDRVHVDAGQAELGRQWDITTALVAGRPAPGGPIGRLYVPRLKLNWIVVEGVNEADITAAPGHYPGTAMPGKAGNFAVAGHRESGIFADLDEVRAGDAVVVETRTSWHTYRIVAVRTVLPTDLAEVAPSPPGMRAGRLLTLTTCAPRWGNSHRLIVHAVLERTTPADQPPEELR